MNRLILVEGLPGTGKTTIAAWLSGILAEQGDPVLLLNEGDERIPSDFYEIAGMPMHEYEQLCANSPQHLALLTEAASLTDHYAFLRIDKCPDPIAAKLRRWDMGDEGNELITAADYIPCALERLQKWVCENTHSAETVIIDSGYLQNPINELLFRHATAEEVRMFIHSMTDVLRPLHPFCIYLQRESADIAIAYAKRAKGSDWADRVDRLLMQSGCIDLFQRRFELEMQLLPCVDHLLCHVQDDDWSHAKLIMKEYFHKSIT